MMSIRPIRPSRSATPAAARAVHADGMNLVQIGQGVELLGQIADLFDRTEIAIHRIDRFEGNQLGRGGVVRLQQGAQMRHIIVAEDPLGAAIAPHAFDHRGMVQRVGIDDQARKQLGQGGQRRVIGDIGRGKDQRRLFAMQIGQLGLQPLVIDRGARDIARAARTCAGGLQRLVHRGQNLGVLAHAQIVIAAPDGDIGLGAIGFAPDCMRIVTLTPLDVDEGAVTPLFVQTVQSAVQSSIIGHRNLLTSCRQLKHMPTSHLDVHQTHI